MLSKYVLYYGKDEPLPEQIPLSAGPLSLIYEAGDLRYIRLGDHEIIRRIYMALRNDHWRTLPNVLSNVEIDSKERSFHITYEVENKQDDIDFNWQGSLIGNLDGTITFAMEGIANSNFLRNQLGICVLHPILECAGQICRVQKADGTLEVGVFPQRISPRQPFLDIRTISYPIADDAWASIKFSGEIFEMEDQRNWMDASFKTYCTPLTLPFPVEVKAGTKISQSVTISLHGKLPETTSRSDKEAPIRLLMDDQPAGQLPKIGLATAGHRQSLSQTELARLKALKLSHLRVDLLLSNPEVEDTLSQAAQEANNLGIFLEVALHLTTAAESELKSLVGTLQRVKPEVCTWLVFHIDEPSTTAKWVELARRYLSDYNPRARIGSGTDRYFAQLNRGRPSTEALDLVSYSISPQVHAFDNTSLIETPPMHRAMVESARYFSNGLPIAVSPITLKPRLHSETALHQVPYSVDARQVSLLGAGWTVAGIKYLAESGVDSVTYYETTGWKGVMETEAGSPLADKFPSLPGAVFPLYHVLADVGEFAGGRIIPTMSSDPLRVDGFALWKDDRTRVIFANLSPYVQRVSLPGLSGNCRIKRLDETNVELAMRSPEETRVEGIRMSPIEKGECLVNVLPYAIIRIDVDLSNPG